MRSEDSCIYIGIAGGCKQKIFLMFLQANIIDNTHEYSCNVITSAFFTKPVKRGLFLGMIMHSLGQRRSEKQESGLFYLWS